MRDFFPPDFTDWRIYVEEMVVTLQIAVWGTLLGLIGMIIALPLTTLLLSYYNDFLARSEQPDGRH